MPKMKTNRSAMKRFKVTGNKKIMARRPGKSHLNEKKRRNRIKRLGKWVEVDKANKKAVRKQIGV